MFKMKEETSKFKVGDIVANRRTKWIGIVRIDDSDGSGEVKTDADGNVSVREIELYDPVKHKRYHIAPSTKREIEKMREGRLEISESSDPELQKVANVIQGIDSLFDMRRPLEQAGFKVDAFNGDTGYVLMVKPKRGGGKTIAIASSNLADDADIVVGKYAIGYLGETVDGAMVEADGESGQRIIKKYSEVIGYDSEDDDAERYSKGSDLEDEESMEPDEYDVEENITAVDKAVEYIQNHGAVEPSNYPQYSKGTWYSTIDGDDDYRTGEKTYYSFHLQGFSPEEEQEIYDRISGKQPQIKERRMRGRLLPKRGTPEFHQFKIAIDTVRNPQKGMFMRGPSEDEAIEMLKNEFGLTDKDIQKIRDNVSITEPVAEAKSIEEMRNVFTKNMKRLNEVRHRKI